MNMVRHLQLLDDPIVSKLKKSELNSIMLENAYHSPEKSKVDSDNDSNENHIQTVDKRRQKQVFNNSQYALEEKTAPLNVPQWMKSGYKGLIL
ncbi:hypothetical protein C1646_823052 [Rhizophagus diaphanus]|nr:hypothetical protein C1646_823052 [Rhizophagus diaphanus] [Rhizophagus sp. MUCL 43196]